MKRFLLSLLLSTICMTSGAWAQSCTANTSLNFGVVDLTTGLAVNGSGQVNITCSGFSAGAAIRVCPGFDPNRTMTRTAGGTISYQLYTSAARTTVWGSTTGVPAFPLDTVITMDSGGNGSGTMTVYASILGGQNTTPTTQSSKLYSANQSVIVGAADAATNPTCANVGNQNPGGGSATFAATYEPVCHFSANALAFGNIPSTLTPSDAATSIVTRCSMDTLYTLTLGDGNGPSVVDPEQRQMQNGPNVLHYGIYRDSTRSAVWGSTSGVNDYSGVGTAVDQSIPVYGRVQVQATPPSGVYTDLVVVTINY